MKSVQEALDQMMPAFLPLGVERVTLDAMRNRYLGEDIVARTDLPLFANSSMDGYAVRAVDTAEATPESPRVLEVAAESRTGGPTPPPLAPGTAIRIFTGAVVPDGADAVVMQENTTAEGTRVAIRQGVTPGNFVRPRGGDLARGSVMLARGARLGAGEIGLLAAQRISR